MTRQLRTLLPSGGNRVKVRVTARETLNAKETTLEQTLGDERIGMLVMDFEGLPMSYESVSTYAAVAQHRGIRLDVEELHNGQGWRRCRHSVEIGDDVLDDDCREKLVQGAQALHEDTFVGANDPHYDAKVFPSISGKLRFVLVSPRDPFVREQFIACARLFHDVWLRF